MRRYGMERNPTYYNEDESYWKWVVLLASFFDQMMIFGLAWGAGVFQVIFMEEFPGKAGVVSLIPTMVPAILSFMGPMSSALSNRFGCRIVGAAGGFLAASGLMLSSFAQSKAYLFATFAIIGCGLGIAFVPSAVVVCYYFIKKRPTAVALSATGLGFGTLFIPPFVRLLVNHYQWRGSLLILGALTLHMVVAAAIFRPIQCNESGAKESRKKIFQVKMLKELPFLSLNLNNVLVLYGIVAFFIHLPPYAKDIGYTDDESATFVSIAGAATIVSRIGICHKLRKL